MTILIQNFCHSHQRCSRKACRMDPCLGAELTQACRQDGVLGRQKERNLKLRKIQQRCSEDQRIREGVEGKEPLETEQSGKEERPLLDGREAEMGKCCTSQGDVTCREACAGITALRDTVSLVIAIKTNG